MMRKLKKSELALLVTAVVMMTALQVVRCTSFSKQGFIRSFSRYYKESDITYAADDPFFSALAIAAEERTSHKVIYDGAYKKIAYPNGDVDPGRGVCTDVVIRSYRALGIDLQELIHMDMTCRFISYPMIWRKRSPDSNIDHRRVPNQMVFFRRTGISLPITKNAADYNPGDIVAWNFGDGLMHVGIVSTQVDTQTNVPLIAHNMGRGPELSDILFKFQIIGHFRYKASQVALSSK